MALYSEKVMDHFQHPRNVGVIEDANGVGEVGNAKCGDIMKMYLKIEDDIIKDVKFETFGCGSAIASSSMATEMIKGKSIHEAHGADQQGRGGGAGRSARPQAPLLRSGRGSHQEGTPGLFRPQRHSLRREGFPRLRTLRPLRERMIVSTKGRYALRVMVCFAQRGGDEYIPLKEIAESEGISQKYLESIMTTLSKAGFVDAVHGKGGGYRLNRPPEEYTIGSILKLTEGSLSAVSCTSMGASACSRTECCQAKPMWDKLDRMIDGFFEGITLADLLHDSVTA